jgi:hypothetical protein
MKKIIVSITEETDLKLRKYIKETYNGRRGALSIIVEEAITSFLTHKNRND